jgi:hypothetical protein
MRCAAQRIAFGALREVRTKLLPHLPRRRKSFDSGPSVCETMKPLACEV